VSTESPKCRSVDGSRIDESDDKPENA
jgi:hypothetical protein